MNPIETKDLIFKVRKYVDDGAIQPYGCAWLIERDGTALNCLGSTVPMSVGQLGRLTAWFAAQGVTIMDDTTPSMPDAARGGELQGNEPPKSNA